MSMWSLCKTAVNDLESFRQACEINDVAFFAGLQGETWNGQEVLGHFKCNQTGGYGYLVRDVKGQARMAMDTDPHFNPMLERLGGSMDRFKLGRDYAEIAAKKALIAQGGMLLSSQAQQDGSLILKVAI